jgi:hypothetical protein
MPIEDHATPEVTAAPAVVIPAIPEPTAAAPAEPVVNAEATESAPEQEHKAESAAERHERESKAEKRIAKLIYQRETAKARADHLEALVNQKTVSNQEGGQAGKQDGRPEQKNFDTAEDFVEALTDWKLAQRDQKSKAQDVQKSQQAAAQKAEKMFSAAESLGNFDRDEFAEKVRVTDVMADAILDSDMGAKLLVHFNANPDEATRIANLSPARQAAEIGKLEAKLSTVIPKVSKAPPPIDPIGGGKATVESLETDDMEAYIALRKKQGARWAR